MTARAKVAGGRDGMDRYAGYPLSFGGGVNSVALAVLLVTEGWREPIVYAETGTEWPETDAYVTMFDGWLRERGLSITRLGPEWRRGKAQMTLIDYCEHYRVTPYARARWCTEKWKIEPLTKWCQANSHDLADMLVGISAEESQRQREKVRPLVDRGIDRDGCARIIAAAGLPVPPKSGCWLCPFQRRSLWRHLYQTHPGLYARAERLEEAATERRAGGKGGTTHLESGGKFTLRQLREAFAAQAPLLDTTEYYMPCLCRV